MKLYKARETCKKWIYRVLIMLVVGTLFCLYPMCVHATETGDEDAISNSQQTQTDAQTQQNELFEEQWELFGGDALFDQLPQETKDLLEQMGMDEITPKALLELKFSDCLLLLTQLLAAQMNRPLALLGVSVALILLSSMLGGLKEKTSGAAISAVFETMTLMAVLAAVSLPVLECIRLAEETMEQARQLMLVFVPLMTAVLSAMAKGWTAAAFSGFLLGAMQLVSYLMTVWLVPFLHIYLAFCLVSGSGVGSSLRRAAEGWRKGVTFLLCGVVSLLLGFWGLQKSLTGAADTVALRTGKLAVSGLVPVVGSALSEAVGSVTVCVGLVKNTMGGFVLLALCLVLLPAVLQCTAFLIGMWLSSVAAQMLQSPQASEMLTCVCNVLRLLLACLALFGVLLLFSTAMLIGSVGG